MADGMAGKPGRKDLNHTPSQAACQCYVRSSATAGNARVEQHNNVLFDIGLSLVKTTLATMLSGCWPALAALMTTEGEYWQFGGGDMVSWTCLVPLQH
jgi:hypothetical protein